MTGRFRSHPLLAGPWGRRHPSRRRAALRGRLGVGAGLLLSAALLVGGLSSTGASAAAQDAGSGSIASAPQGSLADGESSLAADLMKQLVEGAASEGGGQLEQVLAGWVFGSNGSGDAAALSQISAELAQIEQTLQQMAAELQVIESEILTQTCLQQGNALQPYVTSIDTLWEAQSPVNYQYVVQQSQAGVPLPAAELTSWANSVVSSMPDALTAIANQIDGSGNGALYSTCVAAQLKAAGVTDFALTDDVYYQAYVQPIVEYWTGIQVKALTMYVEAQHYLACRSANQCGNSNSDISDLPEQVCGQASPGSPAYQFCQLAQRQVIGSSATSGTRGVLAQQLVAAGAAYTVPREQGTLPAPSGSITSLQQWQQSLTNQGKPPKLGDLWLVGDPPLLSGLPSFANRAAQSGDVIYYASTQSSPGEQWFNSGPPPATDSETRTSPVHRYVGTVGDTSTSGLGAFLWASDLLEFQQQNSPQSCQAVDSANPCGILKGLYSDETMGGTFAYYGEDQSNGTWQAASGPLFRAAFDGGRNNMKSYAHLDDWMGQERHFAETPSNMIIITSEVVGFKPDLCAGCTTQDNVDMLTFTDTGIGGAAFDHPYWWGGDGDENKVSNPYFSQQSSKLSKPYGSAFYFYVDDPFKYVCSPLWKRNPDLPSSQYNGSFYAGYASRGADMYYPKSQGTCSKAPVGPGFTTNQSGAANKPQFRVPVLYVGATTQGQETVTCDEYRGDLGTIVPTSKYSSVAQTYTMCGNDLATWLDAQLGELDPPSAVTQPRAKKVKKHRATVVWKAPQRAGHGKVIKYQTRIKGPGKGAAKCRKSKGGCWTKWRTTDAKPSDRKLRHVHRKLKADGFYRVQLRAVSAVGPGKAKTVRFRTKPSGIPVRPGKG